MTRTAVLLPAGLLAACADVRHDTTVSPQLSASATAADAQVPRNGPEWDGKDHQPTQAEVVRRENRAGVRAPRPSGKRTSGPWSGSTIRCCVTRPWTRPAIPTDRSRLAGLFREPMTVPSNASRMALTARRTGASIRPAPRPMPCGTLRLGGYQVPEPGAGEKPVLSPA